MGFAVKNTLASLVLLSTVFMAVNTHAQQQSENRGWYFSRANCLGVNDSFVWKASLSTAFPDRMIIPLPIPGLVKLPNWRRATGWHYYKYDSRRNHFIESSPTLEYTWRAHAGHFPTLESYPQVRILWTTRVVRRVIVEPIRGGGRGRGERPRTRTRIVFTVVRVPILVVDRKPWRVEGTHYERFKGLLIVRTTVATGCNWKDTFNLM